MSPDVEKVVGGFSDSVVRTWDLTSGENDDEEDNEEDDEKEVEAKKRRMAGRRPKPAKIRKRPKKYTNAAIRLGNP